MGVENNIDTSTIAGQLVVDVAPTLHLGTTLYPVVEVGFDLSQIVPALGLELILAVGVAPPLLPLGISAKGRHPLIVAKGPAKSRFDVQVSALEAEAQVQVVGFVLLLQEVVADALETRFHTSGLGVDQVESDLCPRRVGALVPDTNVTVVIPARNRTSLGLADQGDDDSQNQQRPDQNQKTLSKLLGSVLVKQHDSFLLVRPISWPGLQTSVLEPI